MVVFTKEEHDLLAETCKWTIMGKFTRTRPSIEIIRTEFAKIIKVKGSLKIGIKDLIHVFIDAENEEEFNVIYSRDFVHLDENNSIKIVKWTPNFKLDAETTLAPIWIKLPDLLWHYYEWDALCRIVGPVGTLIVMDKETLSKTRPTTSKLRIEIDLAEPLITEVIVEIRNSRGELEVFEQKIEYENILAYCFHYKLQAQS